MKSRWIGLVFVVVFSVLFAIRQYQPGMWLMGWDSLHPEFNYKLAFERVLSGAWRESQGVGAVAVHSHMSELPRIVTLWTIDLFVPTSAVRWVYVLIMLVLGFVGSYVLLVNILSRMRRSVGTGWVTCVSIVGAFTYLFNLSTLHHFLVPFEMFVVMFGLLPLSLWSAARYLEMPKKSRLIILLLIQLFLSSTAFAATLWSVYYGVFVLATWFISQGNRKAWIRVQALTLLINAYWLLPTMYGLIRTGVDVANAKINLMFSPEAWLNNVAYGFPISVLQLESFILQWLHYDFGKSQFVLVVTQWINTNNGRHGLAVLNIIIGLIALGFTRWLYLGLVERDKGIGKWTGILLAGLLLFSILLSQVWPLSFTINWAREQLPLVGEILRTPFTKVSIPLQLIYAILISMGLLWIVEKFRYWLLRILALIIATIVILTPFSSWFTKGNLMGDVVVNKMPQEYLNLFENMKEFDEGRVVAMPVQTMWGWEYRDWGNNDGYEGANFTQFGIPQPLLIRDFDRWSPYNETFYNQLSTALYERNKNDVARVSDQYDVKYVLLDESVIAPGQDNKILRREETKQMARDLGWQERFQEGFLTVWEVPGDYGQQFVSAPERFTFAEGETTKVRKEVIWKENGTYVSEKGGVIYPFADLMREEVNGVSYDGDNVAIERKIDGQEGQRLIVPGLKGGQKIHLAYTARVDKDKLRIVWQPLYTINGQTGPKLADQEFPVSGGNGVWVKMNESRPLWVEIDKEVKGDAELTTDEAIKLNVYKGEGRQQVVSDLWLERNIQENCGEGIVCISIPLAKPKNESLVQVVQKYAKRRPIVCIDREGEPYRCEETVEQSVNPIITTIDTKSGEQDWLDIAMKGNKTELMKDLDLPWVINFPILNSEEIDPVIWQEFTEAKEFLLQGPTLKVKIETQPIIYDLATLGSQEITNCDVLKRGSVTKENNKYTANERGAGCDYVEMKNLDIQVPYLMRMRGEDVTGRSLKFFLHNTGSGRNDIEYLLDKGSFDQNFAVLPWEFPGQYTLNVETRSFGQETINTLEPVEMRYFPIEQIAGAKIIAASSDHLPKIAQGSELKIKEVKKTGTWLYKVRTEGKGLLKLSQGFDKGWVGVGLTDDGGFDLAHMKVNGWANGWMVLEGVDKVVLLYWPQLLEYLGFILLGATILVMVRLKK